MSSTTASRPAEASSAAPTFSYAQAAKGRTASSTASAVQSSQATSGVSTPAKEAASSTHTPSASINGAPSSDAGERITNGTHDIVSKVDPLGVGVNMETKSKSQPFSESLPDSPSFGTTTTTTLPKDEELKLTGSVSDAVWERGSRFEPSTPDKPSDTNEGRRSKKGKKQQKSAEKEPEKEKEEVKPEVLVAAPPPSVNIWMQRKEAQAAKTKPSPTLPQSEIPESTSLNDAIKSLEAKKRAKTATEDEDKVPGVTQNGTAKDASTSSKSLKKASDGAVKPKEDATKRAARGARAGEKDEKAPTNQLPPPVADAMSWPTPETALEEEKRKPQKSEKDEKFEASSNKPRPKEKWVTVPYVPSVNFNTPLPTRGGRGRGGGRGGRESNERGSHTSARGGVEEKATATSATAAPETRGRGGSDATRAASLPPNSAKRPASNTRERKSPATTPAERAKAPVGTAARGTSVSGEQPGESSYNQQAAQGDSSKKLDQGPFNETYSKYNTADRRESVARGPEQFKDGGLSKDNGQARDRENGRTDRGRGGIRGGRGNHSYPNNQHPQHAYANGHAAQPPNGYPLRHNSTPYSTPIQQGPFTNQFAPPPSRGRGGSRSQSIPNAAMYGRGYPDIRQMAQLQTGNPYMDMQQPMSAVPYNPFSMDQYSVLAMVTMQLEYYFSIDNLCKDVFLRKHMDGQGFVFLTFIAGFTRIKALTHDFDLLRYACIESRAIEIIQGEDGLDRVRRKEGWEKWVMGLEERDESCRNAGPQSHIPPQARNQHTHQSSMSGHQLMSPPPFSPNGTEPTFSPYPNEARTAPNMNGNGIHHPETPLSAAVPDFAPVLPPSNGFIDSLEEQTFSDEDVQGLMLVTSPKSTPAPRGAASRTFSNGSIDGNSINEDNNRQGRTLTNGSHVSETSPDTLLRSRSPFTPLSPNGTPTSNSPAVMWAKGKSSTHQTQAGGDEKYVNVRERALRNRASSATPETHHDMKVLYEFWAHFLVRNFNRTMYAEFRKYALEDAKKNAPLGIEQLGRYYDQVLNKPKTISQNLASHYIELVKEEKANTESGGPSPSFSRLRAAWRNGALDMKSRKQIDNLLDATLKEELER